MTEAEKFERNEPYRIDSYRTEPGQSDLVRNDDRNRTNSVREPLPRAVGSPLPMGSGGSAPQGQGEGQPLRSAPPPGRALSATVTASSEPDPFLAMQRALGAFKPFVQRLLPMIDGNFASAVANLLTPHPLSPPPAIKVDLTPIEQGLTELQLQQSDLRGQVMEQTTSVKRVEDQLEMVREATDRNTLEQQELIEDLKAVSNKVNVFALLLMGLLVISFLLNLVLFLHIQRVLP